MTPCWTFMSDEVMSLSFCRIGAWHNFF